MLGICYALLATKLSTKILRNPQVNKIFEALLFALITAFIHLKTCFKKCVLLGYLLKKEGTAIFFWNRPHVLLVKMIFCGVLVLLIFFRKLGGIKHQFALFLIVFRESSIGN